MKMVKSLLLGSAAGLVAVAGAQAADLPVKAKPVQYVKICSLYGVGFYYIPGTDMCIKIGGWVRAEAAWGVNNSSVGSFIGDVNNRTTGNTWWRIRGYITADARNQTEYGTVRGYLAVGLSTNTNGLDNAGNQFDANRAFIQWAGFTFGRAQSFFDFYSQAALGYLGFTPNSDTGDGGKEVFAYTAQFGNGFSASISAESRRVTQIVNIGANNPTALPCGTLTGGGFTATGSNSNSIGCYGGWQTPDVVANLRVDQAWGSAQIGGAWHQVNASYYANSVTGTALTQFEANGHPGNENGWAAMAGLRLNAPMIGVGDYLAVQGIYTQGALRYLFQNPGTGNMWLGDNQNAMFGLMSDGVYGGNTFPGAGTNLAGTSVQLTTAWGVNAGYEHFWNPQWRTSLYGGYVQTSYNGTANALVCAGLGFATVVNNVAVANPGCDANWNQWWIGSRTQWNVTKDFYMGVDVAYIKFSSMSVPGGVTGGATGTGALVTNANIFPANTNTFPRFLDDEATWSVRFRVHRDFYP
jgi:Porin subfamily